MTVKELRLKLKNLVKENDLEIKGIDKMKKKDLEDIISEIENVNSELTTTEIVEKVNETKGEKIDQNEEEEIDFEDLFSELKDEIKNEKKVNKEKKFKKKPLKEYYKDIIAELKERKIKLTKLSKMSREQLEKVVEDNDLKVSNIKEIK